MPMYPCEKCETWILAGQEHECKNNKPFNVIMLPEDIDNLKKNQNKPMEETK